MPCWDATTSERAVSFAVMKSVINLSKCSMAVIEGPNVNDATCGTQEYNKHFDLLDLVRFGALYHKPDWLGVGLLCCAHHVALCLLPTSFFDL